MKDLEEKDYEELKDRMAECWVWSKLLRILDERIFELKEWFAEEVIEDNKEKLKELGAKIDKTTLVEIMEIIEAGEFALNIADEKVVRLFNSMHEEYKKKLSEDLLYQDVIEIHKFIEEKTKEAYQKLYHFLFKRFGSLVFSLSSLRKGISR